MDPVYHDVKFNLMGVLAPLPAYKSGDCVNYGGMVYRPVEMCSGAVRMEYRPGGKSLTRHEAWVCSFGTCPTFYCS